MSTNEELGNLKKEVDQLRQQLSENALREEAKNSEEAPLDPHLRVQRMLHKGHFAKIYGMQWASDSTRLISAGQDAKILVWNAYRNMKTHAVKLDYAWVLSCGISPSNPQLVCSAGLDQICSVYKLSDTDITGTLQYSLQGHTEWIAQCAFAANGADILTVSGDMQCIRWDVETGMIKAKYKGHSSDVVSVHELPGSDLFVTGGCDGLVKLWDKRESDSVGLDMPGNESDVNSVKFFPNGTAVGSGGDDSSCRIFDIRKLQQMINMHSDRYFSSVASVDFSKSGRLMYAGYEDSRIRVWDVLHGKEVQTLDHHTNRISVVEVSPDGNALAASSWDTSISIYA